jgi:hypothetical protein
MIKIAYNIIINYMDYYTDLLERQHNTIPEDVINDVCFSSFRWEDTRRARCLTLIHLNNQMLKYYASSGSVAEYLPTMAQELVAFVGNTLPKLMEDPDSFITLMSSNGNRDIDIESSETSPGTSSEELQPQKRKRGRPIKNINNVPNNGLLWLTNTELRQAFKKFVGQVFEYTDEPGMRFTSLITEFVQTQTSLPIIPTKGSRTIHSETNSFRTAFCKSYVPLMEEVGVKVHKHINPNLQTNPRLRGVYYVHLKR